MSRAEDLHAVRRPKPAQSPRSDRDGPLDAQRKDLTIVAHARVAWNGDTWVTKNRLAELFDGLCQLGWEPRLVARPGLPADYLSTPVPSTVEVVPFRATLTSRSFLPEAFRLLSSIRQSSHVLAFMPSLVGAFAAMVGGRRVVVYAGSAWGLRRAGRWRILLERAAGRRAGVVVTHGEALESVYRRHGARVQAAVPLVNHEVAEVLASPAIAARSPRGNRPLRLLFVGSIGEEKGVLTLLAALRAIDEPIDARIIGPEQDAATVEGLSEFVTAAEDARWLGYLEWTELRDNYRWADVLVLPSRNEGFPRVVYEATAFGAALVVTPVGGIPHRLRDNTDAIFVPPDDAEALAQALRQLVRDAPLAARLNESARKALAPLFIGHTAATLFDQLLLDASRNGARTATREPATGIPQ
jgi:glycosyltransferase involved in cell wall biosynthesis